MHTRCLENLSEDFWQEAWYIHEILTEKLIAVCKKPLEKVMLASGVVLSTDSAQYPHIYWSQQCGQNVHLLKKCMDVSRKYMVLKAAYVAVKSQ